MTAKKASAKRGAAATRKVAAKKSGTKKSGTKKSAGKKAAGKKSAAGKTASKKAATGKATARKAAAKRGATRRAAAEKTSTPPPPGDRATAESGKAAARGGSVTAQDVTLGHVFALRPRVNTKFRPNDFMQAKRMLREERYASLEDAARALAEEALSLTRRDARRPQFRKQGR